MNETLSQASRDSECVQSPGRRACKWIGMGLKWLLVPIVVVAGLTLAAPDRVEAARWRVYAGGPYPYGSAYAYRYRAPRYYGYPGPVVAPVYPAPVMVAPRPYGVYYGAPRPIYRAPYYYSW